MLSRKMKTLTMLLLMMVVCISYAALNTKAAETEDRRINKNEYIEDESGYVWFKEYYTSLCDKNVSRYTSKGNTVNVYVNYYDTPRYLEERELNGTYWIDLYRIDSNDSPTRVRTYHGFNYYNLSFTATVDLSSYEDGNYYMLIHLGSHCADTNMYIKKMNGRLYFAKPYSKKTVREIKDYNALWEYLGKVNPKEVLSRYKNTSAWADIPLELRTKAKNLAKGADTEYEVAQRVYTWGRNNTDIDGFKGYTDDSEYGIMEGLYSAANIPCLRCGGHYFLYVDGRWIVNDYGWDDYPVSEFNQSKYELASGCACWNSGADNFDMHKGEENTGKPGIKYSAYFHNLGWEEYKYDGQKAGIKRSGCWIEQMWIELNNRIYRGDVTFRVYIQKNGWTKWNERGWSVGHQGSNLRFEALQVKLTEDMAKMYDVYYRIYTTKFGWLGWAKNGGSAGTFGYSCGVECFQAKLVKKGAAGPAMTKAAFKKKR